MSIVYVVSAVNGKNLLPAKEFGKLHVILGGGETNYEAWGKLTTALEQMNSSDYLLLIGHPLHIGFAVHIVMKLWSPDVKFLIWDRVNYNYRIERITDGKHQSANESTSK